MVCLLKRVNARSSRFFQWRIALFVILDTQCHRPTICYISATTWVIQSYKVEIKLNLISLQIMLSLKAFLPNPQVYYEQARFGSYLLFL